VNKVIELAKKLKALADKGIGGEKTNAETLLKKFLKKHNLSIDDIENKTEYSHYYFKAKGINAHLLNQIAKRVRYDMRVFDVYKFAWKNKGGNIGIECTVAEYIEVEAMYELYKPLYASELKIFYKAFLMANDLLARPPETKKASDLTKEELKEYLRQSAMASNIDSKTFRKQLTV